MQKSCSSSHPRAAWVPRAGEAGPGAAPRILYTWCPTTVLRSFFSPLSDLVPIHAYEGLQEVKNGRIEHANLLKEKEGYIIPSLWELEPRVFDQLLALNLRSGYLIARVVVPAMLKQRGGAIVNIASKAAVDHAAGAAAYAASKAAAVAMIDSLAADLKGTGVRANSILPSIIDTDVNRRAMPNVDFAQWPKPEDIARIVIFLCSDDGKLIHGAAIPVYGDT